MSCIPSTSKKDFSLASIVEFDGHVLSLSCIRDQVLRPVRLADSYRCWFVYVREKYCWLVRVNSSHVRGLASQPSPSDQAAYLVSSCANKYGRSHRPVRLAYKPYFFNQRTIFFSHNKSTNSIFSHGLSVKLKRAHVFATCVMYTPVNG